jgi:hypothetical protein
MVRHDTGASKYKDHYMTNENKIYIASSQSGAGLQEHIVVVLSAMLDIQQPYQGSHEQPLPVEAALKLRSHWSTGAASE